MKHGIHPVTNLEELAQLRRLTIGQSDFQVVEQALAIDEKDKIGVNFGYFHQGKLISTLRFYPVRDAVELERQLDYPRVYDEALSFPGVVIGKAGSLPEARGKGHIRELLIHGLKHFSCQGLNFAALTTKPSNRLNPYFEALGFECRENSAGWHRFGYNSLGSTLVFLKRFDLELLCGG